MLHPEQIDRYRILNIIAEGAMGVVFRAQDPAVDREVAIKVVQFYPGMDPGKQEEYRKRFTREAQVVGRLKHPNIVAIHDAREYRGSPYIVMEYVNGTNLDEMRKQNSAIQMDKALRYAEQIASALDYAHSKGIIHRDIKPSNILIDKEDNVKVVDFGIAKLVDSDLTQPYQVLGSPSYMSPEQIAGGPLDGRTDVFSTGVLLYYIITGRKPFEAGNISGIVQRILNDNPEPPSSINRDIPRNVDYAIMRALSKEPSERFKSLAEFVAMLVSEQIESKRDIQIKSIADIFQNLLMKMNLDIDSVNDSGGDIFIYAIRQDPVLKGNYLFRILLRPDKMKVSVSTIREALRLVQDKKLTKSIVITNTDFTKEAWDFIEGKPVDLVNGAGLEELFKKYMPAGFYELSQRLPRKSVELSRQGRKKEEEETTRDVTPTDRIFFTKTQESRKRLQEKGDGFFGSFLKKK